MQWLGACHVLLPAAAMAEVITEVWKQQRCSFTPPGKHWPLAAPPDEVLGKGILQPFRLLYHACAPPIHNHSFTLKMGLQWAVSGHGGKVLTEIFPTRL